MSPAAAAVTGARVGVFASRDHLPSGVPHVPFLSPFWGLPPGESEALDSRRFEGWLQEGPAVVELVDPDEAAAVVLPGSWERMYDRPEARALLGELQEIASARGLPVLVFEWSDVDHRVPIEEAVVFRTSLFRSRRTPRDHAMPAWSDDLGATGTQPRPWRPRPVVGFCGFAPGLGPRRGAGLRRGLVSFRNLLRTTLKGGWDDRVRRAALERLAASSELETNFVLRPTFWGRGDRDLVQLRAQRQEYVDVARESDYVFCVRGAGNFSYRLYETLSLGRVPVFLDTDCVLPCEHRIDWESLMVVVPARELDEIGATVAAFHARLGPEGFGRLQHECRRVWEEYLRPEGFFRSLVDDVRSGLLPAAGVEASD